MTLIGLVMKYDDTPCKECGGVAVVIGEPSGPHAGALHCQTCGRHRGWLPKTVADFLTETINRFGSPKELIKIRTPAGLRAAASPDASAALQPMHPETGTGVSGHDDD
jgi:hypothetical protein